MHNPFCETNFDLETFWKKINLPSITNRESILLNSARVRESKSAVETVSDGKSILYSCPFAFVMQNQSSSWSVAPGVYGEVEALSGSNSGKIVSSDESIFRYFLFSRWISFTHIFFILSYLSIKVELFNRCRWSNLKYLILRMTGPFRITKIFVPLSVETW